MKAEAAAAAAAVGEATLLPPFKTEERGSDWNDVAASRDRETFMRELRSGFAIAQRQALTKEAKAERLAPQLTQEQVAVPPGDSTFMRTLPGAVDLPVIAAPTHAYPRPAAPAAVDPMADLALCPHAPPQALDSAGAGRHKDPAQSPATGAAHEGPGVDR